MGCGRVAQREAAGAPSSGFRSRSFGIVRRRASTFGLAIIRKIGRLNETATWPLLAKSANGYVSSFGELTGLQLDRAPKRLEVVPYLVGDVTTQPGEPGNPLINTTDPDGIARRRFEVCAAPGLTLTGTINPDFGQVEADPAVVNLSAFETFFSERRPFFVEGGGIFSFDVDCNDGELQRPLLFAPNRPHAARAGGGARTAATRSAPAQTTILGAAKLTGRIGNFSVGALNAVTADEDAVIAQRNGPDSTDDRAAHQLRGRPRPARIHESVVAWVHDDVDQSEPRRRRHEFLPGRAYTGGSMRTGASARSTRSAGFSPEVACRGSAGDRRTAAEQRAQFSAARIPPASPTIRLAPR